MLDLSFDEKYKQLKKDSLYNGLFFTAVITTGIFCKPSCRAKRPKKENVLFYDSAQEAIQNWFRPCKICNPMNIDWTAPIYITELIKRLHWNIYQKITDQNLLNMWYKPYTIRRWFQKNHNMTFHAYQRLLRINQAYNNIKGGNSISRSAFGSWYISLSNFNDEWKTIFWSCPRSKDKKGIINIIRIATEIWPMFACSFKSRLCLLKFTNDNNLEDILEELREKYDAIILPWKSIYLEWLEKYIHKILLDYKNKIWIKQLQFLISKQYMVN